MSEKSKVKKIFKDFYNMIENQFQTKISILKTDNGTEYFNNCLGMFLTEKGIQHQSTCRDTPQQNGIAERKNCHLLEIARSITFSIHVPKYLWGDAILTACYLINRMPTRVLQYITPLACLKKIFFDCRITKKKFTLAWMSFLLKNSPILAIPNFRGRKRKVKMSSGKPLHHSLVFS